VVEFKRLLASFCWNQPKHATASITIDMIMKMTGKL